MKRILLLIAVVLSTAVVQKVAAQSCSVSNLKFNIKSYTPLPGGGCSYVVDVGFDIAHNKGNKFAFVNLWLSGDYPGYTYGSYPTSAQLISSNAIGTFEIAFGSTDALVTNTYSPDGGGSKMLSGTLTKTSSGGIDKYLISNATISFSTCPGNLSVTGDVWSSQASHGQTVQCFNKNLVFLPPTNNFSLTGIFFCTLADGSKGRQYNVQMSSNNTAANPLNTSYTVYVDNGDGSFLLADETSVASQSGISLYSGNSYNTGRVSYLPYSNTPPSANHDLWVFANVISNIGQFSQLLRITNGCISLPVSLKSFTASRNGNLVQLTWVTSLEQNNKGFEVQRQVGQGQWEKIGFIPSQAANGNSNSAITYKFNDPNSLPGVSNYRLLQVDFDGQYAYSQVVAVRAAGQSGKIIIYPNPSSNGAVNIVFDNKNVARDVILMDMAGRVLKQWGNITTNNLQVQELVPGFYNLRVVVRETGETSVQKIVITSK